MVRSKKNNPAEDLMASLLKEVGDADEDILNIEIADSADSSDNEKLSFLGDGDNQFDLDTKSEYEATRLPESTQKIDIEDVEKALLEMGQFEESAEPIANKSVPESVFKEQEPEPIINASESESLFASDDAAVTQANTSNQVVVTSDAKGNPYKAALPDDFNAGDKTLAVTGFHNKPVDDYQDKVKISIGQNRSAYSQGYAGWGSGSEASLGQAENLRMAQEKILDLEKENENLRIQNEELISASDIIKERSDLLTSQVNEYKNDKENLEESFKNEIALLKGHLQRKEVELQKAQLKIDDLDSRFKCDMKKSRIRERELENRLELIRAEKNALTKSKDEQILDLRRKMDVLQMEVESYRQKCVDLNKTLEVNQDSFKRTTRALRLAMANLELQEENKPALKKVD